jgi:hypothetical protein
MATRNEWNTYRLDDGLNIWGDPEFQGIPVFAGGLEHGDEVVDTLVTNGRMATGSLAGSALDIDATYTYNALEEIRADVSDWTGVGGTFIGRYSRISTSVTSVNQIYSEQIYAANADGVDVALLQSVIFNTMGKGNSTIDLMRGGEIKCEWLATDIVTNAVGLVIEFMGLAAPTNPIFGLWFEKDSAAGAMVPYFREIRMKEGVQIISSTADPNGVITAPAGSLCLVTSGSGAADRLWMNTDSGTTWTSVTCTA